MLPLLDVREPMPQLLLQIIDDLKSAMTQKQLSLMAIQTDWLDFCIGIFYYNRIYMCVCLLHIRIRWFGSMFGTCYHGVSIMYFESINPNFVKNSSF